MAEREINLDKRGLTNTVKSVGVITTFAVALGSAEQSPASAAEVQEALKNSPDPVVNDDSGEIEKREEAFQQTIVYSSGPSTDHPEQGDDPEVPDDPPEDPNILSVTPSPTAAPNNVVNARAGAGTNFEEIGSFIPGEQYKVVAIKTGNDGYPWLLFEDGRWGRGDLFNGDVDQQEGIIALDSDDPEIRSFLDSVLDENGNIKPEKQGIDFSLVHRLMQGSIDIGFPENTITDGGLELFLNGEDIIVVQKNQVGINPSGSVFVFVPTMLNGETVHWFNFYPENIISVAVGREVSFKGVSNGGLVYQDSEGNEIYFDREGLEEEIKRQGRIDPEEFRDFLREIEKPTSDENFSLDGIDTLETLDGNQFTRQEIEDLQIELNGQIIMQRGEGEKLAWGEVLASATDPESGLITAHFNPEDVAEIAAEAGFNIEPEYADFMVNGGNLVITDGVNRAKLDWNKYIHEHGIGKTHKEAVIASLSQYNNPEIYKPDEVERWYERLSQAELQRIATEAVQLEMVGGGANIKINTFYEAENPDNDYEVFHDFFAVPLEGPRLETFKYITRDGTEALYDTYVYPAVVQSRNGQYVVLEITGHTPFLTLSISYAERNRLAASYRTYSLELKEAIMVQEESVNRVNSFSTRSLRTGAEDNYLKRIDNLYQERPELHRIIKQAELKTLDLYKQQNEVWRSLVKGSHIDTSKSYLFGPLISMKANRD